MKECCHPPRQQESWSLPRCSIRLCMQSSRRLPSATHPVRSAMSAGPNPHCPVIAAAVRPLCWPLGSSRPVPALVNIRHALVACVLRRGCTQPRAIAPPAPGDAGVSTLLDVYAAWRARPRPLCHTPEARGALFRGNPAGAEDGAGCAKRPAQPHTYTVPGIIMHTPHACRALRPLVPLLRLTMGVDDP